MMEERSANAVLQGRKGGKSSGLIKVTVEPGRHRLKLRVWSSTLEVKQAVQSSNPVPVSWQRLFLNNVELLNSQRLIDFDAATAGPVAFIPDVLIVTYSMLPKKVDSEATAVPAPTSASAIFILLFIQYLKQHFFHASSFERL